MLARPAVVNNLMPNNDMMVLAVGAPSNTGGEFQMVGPQKLLSVRNSMIQPSAMNRSWTRPVGSAGMDLLPYAGHLPTLGLIKKNR